MSSKSYREHQRPCNILIMFANLTTSKLTLRSEVRGQTGQRRIQEPFKHLWWKLLQTISNVNLELLTTLVKTSTLDTRRRSEKASASGYKTLKFKWRYLPEWEQRWFRFNYLSAFEKSLPLKQPLKVSSVGWSSQELFIWKVFHILFWKHLCLFLVKFQAVSIFLWTPLDRCARSMRFFLWVASRNHKSLIARTNNRAGSLTGSDFHLETKGSRFEPGCKLWREMSFLQ